MLFSLYQILLNLSQRYKNSSRAAVGPGELVCVCWGGGLCSCGLSSVGLFFVCLSLSRLSLSQSKSRPPVSGEE